MALPRFCIFMAGVIEASVIMAIVIVLCEDHVLSSDPVPVERSLAFPAVDELPPSIDLPDPFLRADGGRVSSLRQWDAQRDYLKRLLTHYMYGKMPPQPSPEQTSVRKTSSRVVFAGSAVEEQFTLTIKRNDMSVDLSVALIRPIKHRRYPAIIKNCRVLFDASSDSDRNQVTAERDVAAARDAVQRGYLLCKFRREDLAADHKDNRTKGIFPLYPEYDWGTIAVWAWTYSLLIDMLEELNYVDMQRVVATGHSRGGQTTIAAGIYDERIDVIVPCTGGYGACGTLRVRDPDGVRGTIDYIAHLNRNVPHWFNSRYLQFAGQQDKLPFDAHTLVALIAPRPLLNTNATEDEYNNTLSIEAGLRTGKRVYDWMQRGDWCRLHWRSGKHGQMKEDWQALLDYADEYFYSKPTSRPFNQWIYPEFRAAISWSAPVAGVDAHPAAVGQQSNSSVSDSPVSASPASASPASDSSVSDSSASNEPKSNIALDRGPSRIATQARLTPLVRVADLNIGESQRIELHNGEIATVKLLNVQEKRDAVMNAIQQVDVRLEVNGRPATLTSGLYRLPTKVGGVQIDCPVTANYNKDSHMNHWGLTSHARFRIWPESSPWIRPGTFVYPVGQRWFASQTWFSNEAVSSRPRGQFYYHAGLDIGGAEGLVPVFAAAAGRVVAAGTRVIEDLPKAAVQPRYDVVYVEDRRGWYYRYSHLCTVNTAIQPGAEIRSGDPIGTIGKEGGSGGWSHLHFEIKSLQPSGQWGTQDGYAFLWQANLRQSSPHVIAVARPRHLALTGEVVTLDGSRSWTPHGALTFHWTFADGTTSDEMTVQRKYEKPGTYSEILTTTNADGESDIDFAIVKVVDRDHPDQLPPGIHPTYYPTTGIEAGDPVVFMVRARNTTEGLDVWNFGDHSPPMMVRSNVDPSSHANVGYAKTTHRFQEAGRYVVSVSRQTSLGTAIGHLLVRVH